MMKTIFQALAELAPTAEKEKDYRIVDRLDGEGLVLENGSWNAAKGIKPSKAAIDAKKQE